MRFLLDTNVISEPMRPAPDRRVTDWLTAQPVVDLAVSVLTLGEIEHGLVASPEGARRTHLTQWARIEMPRHFADRLLDVDARIAIAWGWLTGLAHVAGRTLPPTEGLLVATAQVHGLTLVTRNVRHCAGRGVPVYDPWTDTLHA